MFASFLLPFPNQLEKCVPSVDIESIQAPVVVMTGLKRHFQTLFKAVGTAELLSLLVGQNGLGQHRQEASSFFRASGGCSNPCYKPNCFLGFISFLLFG